MRTFLSHRPARPWPKLRSTRTFVNLAVYRILVASPAGRAAIEAFTIQRPQDCVSNAQDIRHAVAHLLAAAGLLLRPPAPERSWWRKLFGRPQPRHVAEPLTPKWEIDAHAVAALCERHGPMVLVVHGILSSAQGGRDYPLHHAVVLLATFVHQGRIIGVVVDGNDLQSNPAIEAARAHLSRSGKRKLHELTREDFEAINRELAARGEPLDVYQMAFRLVDLEGLVQRAKAAYARRVLETVDEMGTRGMQNRASYSVQSQVTGEILDSAVRAELEQAVAASPELVERFTL